MFPPFYFPSLFVAPGPSGPGSNTGPTIITNQGEKLFLNSTLSGRLFLRLFRNDVPVLLDSTLTDFDVALFPGYADVEITADWSSAVIDQVGRAFSRIGNITWTRGAGGIPETEYGWLMYQNVVPDSVMVAGQRFHSPIFLSSPGQTVKVSLIGFLLRG